MKSGICSNFNSLRIGDELLADSHCHAWRMWPYDTSAPDPEDRGSFESLLYEMDRNEIERASIVCARIGGGAGGAGYENRDNNFYVSDFASRYPDRISAWVDVDSMWSQEHHTSGAASRLRVELDRHQAKGFTHYVNEVNDGWLVSEEGLEFFALAAKSQVVASLSISAGWLEDLQIVASTFPTLPILIHHMSIPRKDVHGYNTEDVSRLLACAKQPNIGVKISGFNYNSRFKWDYPFTDSRGLFEEIYKAFGADRLYWGSDFPASRDSLTYSQSLEVVRQFSDFLSQQDLSLILGDNLNRLLNQPYLVANGVGKGE
jgi:L-fuconolactonase